VGAACSTEELKLADIDTYLIKPVKQSRLFDCLVNTAGKAPVRDIVAVGSVGFCDGRLSGRSEIKASAHSLGRG
jgi:hypothetical protein